MMSDVTRFGDVFVRRVIAQAPINPWDAKKAAIVDRELRRAELQRMNDIEECALHGLDAEETGLLLLVAKRSGHSVTTLLHILLGDRKASDIK